MKKRLEHLLFSDAERLPLLSLIPEPSEFSTNAAPPLERLRPALLARLENARAAREEGELAENGESDGDPLSPISDEAIDERQSELSMLQAALDWMSLQEERSS